VHGFVPSLTALVEQLSGLPVNRLLNSSDRFSLEDSPLSHPSSSADRNLLLGMLALQMDFIRQEALIAAKHAWVLDKSLGEILVTQIRSFTSIG
jgi:hypothetical protein